MQRYTYCFATVCFSRERISKVSPPRLDREARSPGHLARCSVIWPGHLYQDTSQDVVSCGPLAMAGAEQQGQPRLLRPRPLLPPAPPAAPVPRTIAPTVEEYFDIAHPAVPLPPFHQAIHLKLCELKLNDFTKEQRTHLPC